MADDTTITRFPAKGNPTRELLSDPLLDPGLRLRDALGHLERLREEWTEARERCDEEADPDKLADARNNLRAAYNRMDDQVRQVTKLEQDVRRRSLELLRQGEWADKYEALLADLKNQYQGRGAHYELLCEHLASVTIRLRMMEASGRDMAGGELVELHKLAVSYVNQLQRYTEAMKTESVNRVTQAVAIQLMNIADRHFGVPYPVEFKAFVSDVALAIEAGPVVTTKEDAA